MTEQAKSTLHSRVKAVWRRQQLLCLADGALAFARWAAAMFLAGVFLDWLIKIPGPGRGAILAVVVGVPFYKAWCAGWRNLCRFNAARTALHIEERNGGMESLLVTAVQLGDAARRGGTSEALCEQTCRKAEERAGSINAGKVIGFQSLRRPAFAGLVAVLILAGLSSVYGPLLLTGVVRIFAPWVAITYPTRTQLELASGDLVVQEGQPVRIAAHVSGVMPQEAEIALRTGKGRPRVRELPVVNGECEYRIETVFRGFDYRIIAGDARSPWHAVEVITAPAIEGAEVRLEYPKYTERSADSVEALTLTVPETTRIHWTLSLDRALREASVNFAGQNPLSMDISDEGRRVSFEQLASESRAYGFSWVEREHGFEFTSPNYYLQVAPDRAPRVELTSPSRNIYATLGRKLDLAFRGGDDHGIAESYLVYSVDKIEEKKVEFAPAAPIDGSEQTIDWDYRSVLPELAVGQTVTFAVELVDHYPGAEGPHRVRSETRRMQFMTREDYLAHVEQQRKRLLSRLKTIYREEREVCEAVMGFDRADPVFVQNCQLEAVRQDLMRERLGKLAERMDKLVKDLVANGIVDESLTASLAGLRKDILEVSDEHVAQAAAALRTLAGASGETSGKAVSGMAPAAHMVDSAARELGLLVLQLGYEDAADVMAREMHAAAQTQAALRLRTITGMGKASALADAQDRLGKWLSRLFEASPREEESTIDEALVEFTLTRLVKQLINAGTEAKLTTASDLIREGRAEQATRLQSEVIQALLQAEFRLRVGAEREALAEAMILLRSQAAEQEKLRLQMQALDPQMFSAKRSELAEAQGGVHRNLQLLLLPEIPAQRTRLFDDVAPKAPPVADLLSIADDAMNNAVANIRKGKKDAALKAQMAAEEAFASLAEDVYNRIAALTETLRIKRLSYGSLEVDERLELFGERQLSLLEKAEDAAADGTKSEYLAEQEQALVDALEDLNMDVLNRIKSAVEPSENSRSLPGRIDEALSSMRQAVSLLADNKPAAAAGHQEATLAALDGARDLLAAHSKNLAAYASMLASTESAVAPSPYVGEIKEEQRDMLEKTRETKPENLPSLALPQKNLIHAVDAILVALDPINHLVETGTVMLFAKADMDAAGTALEDQDPVEALDAQEFIVETLQELRAKIGAVVPQYQYLLEVVEALHGTVQESVLIREEQRRLRENAVANPEALAALVKEQATLKKRTEAYGKLIASIAGLGRLEAAGQHMAAAEKALETGDSSAAVDKMAMAEEALKNHTSEILTLMEHLTLVLSPPELGQEIPSELTLLRDVLALAARQKNVYRESFAAKPDRIAEFEQKLLKFKNACEPLIDRAKQHRKPMAAEQGNDAAAPPPGPANVHLNLLQAKLHLAEAAGSCKKSTRAEAMAGQYKAAESLRHFVTLYALTFVNPPGPPPPGDPVPSEDFSESEDMMQLFMPGAVTGKRPPDGRLEWEVLGKRDRAALNENFARELPLEYRAILKDYYERLAR